jgi:hypothetical protein
MKELACIIRILLVLSEFPNCTVSVPSSEGHDMVTRKNVDGSKNEVDYFSH